MNTALRYILLVPLGLLFGVTATMLAILLLTIFVPELALTIGNVIVAAFNALFDAIMREDNAAISGIGWRAWQMTMATIIAPVVLTAVIGEFFRLSALAHAIISGLVATAIPFAATGAQRAPSGAESRVLACLFFAGAAGGLIYYLIGGRKDAPSNAPPTQQVLPPR